MSDFPRRLSTAGTLYSAAMEDGQKHEGLMYLAADHIQALERLLGVATCPSQISPNIKLRSTHCQWCAERDRLLDPTQEQEG